MFVAARLLLPLIASCETGESLRFKKIPVKSRPKNYLFVLEQKCIYYFKYYRKKWTIF